jgi:RES domain-containing protein
VNLSGRKYLTRRSCGGRWYRAVPAEFHDAALAYEPSTDTPSRFNPGRTDRPGIPILYLTEDPAVSLFETRVLAGTYLPWQPAAPNLLAKAQAVVPITVQLASVIDLCDPSQIGLLHTSVQELSGDWLGYQYRPYSTPYPPPAPTQLLGAALFRLPRVEGVLTYSAHAPTRRNLVVFPTKLRPGSSVAVVDPASGDVLLSLP